MVPHSASLARQLSHWLIILVVICLSAPRSAAAAPAAGGALAVEHLVHNVTFNIPSPNILDVGQSLLVAYSYKTSAPDGVRIYIQPFANGALVSDIASGHTYTTIRPVGEGVGTEWFFALSSGYVIDQIRITMTSEDRSKNLFQVFIPVHYQIRGSSHAVSDLSFAPANPNIRPYEQKVTVSYKYRTTDTAGVKIFISPFSQGKATPNSFTNSVPAPLPSGEGNSSSWFYVKNQPATVDQLRIQIYTADQSALLFEAFIPVHFEYRPATDVIAGFVPDQVSPTVMEHSRHVTWGFYYQMLTPGPFEFKLVPLSHGAPAPGAQSSPFTALTSYGPMILSFTILSGPVIVDQLRVEVWKKDPAPVLYYSTSIPVHYQYGPVYRQYLPLAVGR